MAKSKISIIGSGATGSFTALALAKMGIGHIDIFDEDGVSEHNLPNQFFRKQDVDCFKVEAIKEIINQFADTKVDIYKKFYTREKLNNTVVTCTDSLTSRKQVWSQFQSQSPTKYFIDGRMGGELAHVFIIQKKKCLIDFYNNTFGQKAEQLPCSERSIIYCVMMIASMVCRAVKATINKEKDFPHEMIFSMKNMIYMDTREL